MSLEARVQRVAVRTTEQRPHINCYMMYHVMLSTPPASSQTFRRQLTLALRIVAHSPKTLDRSQRRFDLIVVA